MISTSLKDNILALVVGPTLQLLPPWALTIPSQTDQKEKAMSPEHVILSTNEFVKMKCNTTSNFMNELYRRA